MKPHTYRKRPVEIQALQWTGDNAADIKEFCGDKVFVHDQAEDLAPLWIYTLEGNMTASIGDFIIRGVQGEFYPCKPEIFKQTYELLLFTAEAQ